jgi:hypothetical protein
VGRDTGTYVHSPGAVSDASPIHIAVATKIIAEARGSRRVSKLDGWRDDRPPPAGSPEPIARSRGPPRR